MRGKRAYALPKISENCKSNILGFFKTFKSVRSKEKFLSGLDTNFQAINEMIETVIIENKYVSKKF